MLAGARGPAAARALDLQRQVGEFFGAEDFVPVTSAHLMAEIESMGEACLRWVEAMADLGARCMVPTDCNPRSCDFERYRLLGQPEAHVEQERRLTRALRRMGVRTLNTCINYQTVVQPRFGEHLAWGDTGTVIYANAVAGARSNFEGGPVALAAGITSRTPRYGYHLDAQRRATVHVRLEARPASVADWGAVGCWIGRRVSDYWQVPAISCDPALRASLTVDQLKHLGASLASYGSLAMFHLEGVTPECRELSEAFGGPPPPPALALRQEDLDGVYASFAPEKPDVDVVVFGTPQLSIFELADLAACFEGRRVHPNTRLIVTTNGQNRAAGEQLGYVQAIEAAGGVVLAGVCYYLVTPRELAETQGWRTLLTDSAKLANIIAGYGYNPIFRPTDVCVRAAIAGRLEE